MSFMIRSLREDKMKFILLTLLYFYLWLTSAWRGGDGPPPATCCLYVSNTKVKFGDLLDYYSQDRPPCPIKAIRFRTKKYKTICSDPEDKWAIRAKEELDKIVIKKPTEKPYRCETSISTQIPTSSTTIETPGPKTKTSTSTATSKDIKTKTAGPETETSTSTANSKDIKTKTAGPETETSTNTANSKVTFKIPGLEEMTNQSALASTESSQSFMFTILRSSKECCLTVTKHKPAFHKIMDYRYQEAMRCPFSAIQFITVENKTICASPTELWVQDYLQNLRSSTAKTSNKGELPIIRSEPTVHDQHKSSQITEKFKMDVLSNVEKKQESIKPATTSPILNDLYENKNIYTQINHFCLKEQKKFSSSYFCVKQP